MTGSVGDCPAPDGAGKGRREVAADCRHAAAFSLDPMVHGLLLDIAAEAERGVAVMPRKQVSPVWRRRKQRQEA